MKRICQILALLTLGALLWLAAPALCAIGQQPSGISGQQPPQPQQVYWLPCWSPLRILLGRPPRYSPYVPVGRPYTVQPVAPAQFMPVQPQGVQ